MTQPTLTVELGYLSGWTLGTSLLGVDTTLATVAYSQDISSRVRSVSIRRGRQHELNRVEAGTASVMVINQDGAMTRIPPMTAIRIRATVSDIVSPDTITGLTAWYDLSLISTLWQDTARTSPITADGQAIKGVTDRSGAGKHMSEATNGPAYKTAIINGQSVARFDGSNDLLAATWTADTSFTLFTVAQERSAPTASVRAVWGLSSNGMIFTSTSFQAGYGFFTPVVDLGGTPANTNILVARVNSAASLDGYINGGTPTNVNPHDDITLATSLILGTMGVNFGDYDIGEVLAYDSALSATDMNKVGAYLADKWGPTWTNV